MLVCALRERLRCPRLARSQSLVSTLWLNSCSQIKVVKHDFNKKLQKIESVKDISYTVHGLLAVGQFAVKKMLVSVILG